MVRELGGAARPLHDARQCVQLDGPRADGQAEPCQLLDAGADGLIPHSLEVVEQHVELTGRVRPGRVERLVLGGRRGLLRGQQGGADAAEAAGVGSGVAGGERLGVRVISTASALYQPVTVRLVPALKCSRACTDSAQVSWRAASQLGGWAAVKPSRTSSRTSFDAASSATIFDRKVTSRLLTSGARAWSAASSRAVMSAAAAGCVAAAAADGPALARAARGLREKVPGAGAVLRAAAPLRANGRLTGPAMLVVTCWSCQTCVVPPRRGAGGKGLPQSTLELAFERMPSLTRRSDTSTWGPAPPGRVIIAGAAGGARGAGAPTQSARRAGRSRRGPRAAWVRTPGSRRGRRSTAWSSAFRPSGMGSRRGALARVGRWSSWSGLVMGATVIGRGSLHHGALRMQKRLLRPRIRSPIYGPAVPGPAELCQGHDWVTCDLEHVDERDQPAMGPGAARGAPTGRAGARVRSARAGVHQLQQPRGGRARLAQPVPQPSAWSDLASGKGALGRICFVADIPLPERASRPSSGLSGLGPGRRLGEHLGRPQRLQEV